MKRYFFIGDSLDELEDFAHSLTDFGLDEIQLRVISNDDRGVEGHHDLSGVNSIMRRDVLTSGLRGALIGLILAVVILGVGYGGGFVENQWTTMLVWFLAIGTLGFCAWEGGFLGIQTHNRHFAQFDQAVSSGKHVFFVDLDQSQVPDMRRAADEFAGITAAGEAHGRPKWLVFGQRELPKLLTETLP